MRNEHPNDLSALDLVDIFFEDGPAEILAPDEITDLCLSAQKSRAYLDTHQGDNSPNVLAASQAFKNAGERILNAHKRLITKEAIYSYIRHKGTVDLPTLIVAGCAGIERAIELYDPQKARFSTHATEWIKGSISNAHRQQYRIEQREVPINDDEADGYYRGKIRRVTEEQALRNIAREGLNSRLNSAADPILNTYQLEILKYRANGLTFSEIGQIYGVTPQAIGDALRNVIFKRLRSNKEFMGALEDLIDTYDFEG